MKEPEEVLKRKMYNELKRVQALLFEYSSLSSETIFNKRTAALQRKIDYLVETQDLLRLARDKSATQIPLLKKREADLRKCIDDLGKEKVQYKADRSDVALLIANLFSALRSADNPSVIEKANLLLEGKKEFVPPKLTPDA